MPPRRSRWSGRRAGAVGRGGLWAHLQVAPAAELRDRGVGVGQRLSVPAVLVLDRAHALALHGAGDDRHGLAVGRRGVLVGGVDLGHVVAVDLDRAPAERLGPGHVGGGVPAEHRLAALPEPVDVDDRHQVVEALVRGGGERLPHRALGHLAVAAERPHPEGQLVEPLARQGDADGDGQPLAERAGGDVHPGDDRRGVALQPRAELAERQQLLVGDGAGGAVERVEQRRGVALREHEVVVRGGSRGDRSRSAGALPGARPSGRPRTSMRWDGPTRRPRPRGSSRPAAAGPARATVRARSSDLLRPEPTPRRCAQRASLYPGSTKIGPGRKSSRPD